MILPKDAEYISEHAKRIADGTFILNVPGVCWFSNIEHGRRHEKLMLDSAENNLRYNLKLKKKLSEYGVSKWPEYDNYHAIEVPFVECIPSDYEGVMGVPITFMDKYCPEQFEILDCNDYRKEGFVKYKSHGLVKDADSAINGNPVYVRVLIRRKV